MVYVMRKVVDIPVTKVDAQVLALGLEHREQRPRIEGALVLHAQAPEGNVVDIQPREPSFEHPG